MARRPHEALDVNRPPPVEPKHAREDVRGMYENLREELPPRHHKPTPEMPGLGSYSGPVNLPSAPRFGDPNVGQNDWKRERGAVEDIFKQQRPQEQEKTQEQQQEQTKRREQER